MFTHHYSCAKEIKLSKLRKETFYKPLMSIFPPKSWKHGMELCIPLKVTIRIKEQFISCSNSMKLNVSVSAVSLSIKCINLLPFRFCKLTTKVQVLI